MQVERAAKRARSFAERAPDFESAGLERAKRLHFC